MTFVDLCPSLCRQGFVVATSVDIIYRKALDQLKKFTCDDKPVSALYGCIWDGQLCSSAGTCTNGVCVCESGREGQYCQEFTSSSSDSLLVILGTHLLDNTAHDTHTHVEPMD
jgi:hypothetical protein